MYFAGPPHPIPSLTPFASAPKTLYWAFRSDMRSGCERYRFHGHTLSVLATPLAGDKRVHIRVATDGPFTLCVTRGEVSWSESIPAGITEGDIL